MTASAGPAHYTLRSAQQILGLSRAVLAGLFHGGFVSPQRGPRRQLLFSFRDLLLIRTAHALRQAGIAPRKILRALTRLQAALPEELPLTGLRITAVGTHIVVRESVGPWEAESGQWLMDFEVAQVDGTVSVLTPASSAAPQPAPVSGIASEAAFALAPAAIGSAPTPPDDNEAEHWFRRGEQAEPKAPKLAEAAYRRALTCALCHVPSYLNLGALLCDSGRCDEAVALYRQAQASGAADALLDFNHAVALDDLGRHGEALAQYEQALARDPSLADAHFNAARLLRAAGHARAALRHLNAYRRLQRSSRP